ncbi:MAG: 6-bladed beta-propeller [Elusimicrobia bacterium]|nr:6-bladed beta-propeller [Elusimicrobiota bacterium]
MAETNKIDPVSKSPKVKFLSIKRIWILLFLMILAVAAVIGYIKFPGVFKCKWLSGKPVEQDKDLFKSSSEISYIMTLGKSGKDKGQFDRPKFIAVDKDGFIYAGDTGNNRIQKFDSNGKFIREWNSAGEGESLTGIFGLAVADNGNVYVTSRHNIIKYDANGRFLKKWGNIGTQGGGNFNNWANGIAIDNDGNVYVGDPNNSRIQKFDADGNFLTAWGSRGDKKEQFNMPYGITADGNGNIYVADTFNHRIQKFNSNGKFVSELGNRGKEVGQFVQPYGLAVDGNGNVYVTDSMNDRVQKFDSKGNFISQWGILGAKDGRLNFPCGIAVHTDKKSSRKYIYVADCNNNRIYKLTPGSPLHAEGVGAGTAGISVSSGEKTVGTDSESKTTNYIYGKVLNIEGKAIPDVTLKFSVEDGTERARSYTDRDGIYKSKELPFGIYRVKVWEERYQPKIKNIKIEEGPPKEYNFRLSRWE